MRFHQCDLLDETEEVLQLQNHKDLDTEGLLSIMKTHFSSKTDWPNGKEFVINGWSIMCSMWTKFLKFVVAITCRRAQKRTTKKTIKPEGKPTKISDWRLCPVSASQVRQQDPVSERTDGIAPGNLQTVIIPWDSPQRRPPKVLVKSKLCCSENSKSESFEIVSSGWLPHISSVPVRRFCNKNTSVLSAGCICSIRTTSQAMMMYPQYSR